jgi:carboxyl-terminal processing protease
MQSNPNLANTCKILLILVLVLGFALSFVLLGKQSSLGLNTDFSNIQGSKITPESELIGLIKSQYLRESPDNEKLIEAKNRGIVASLDDPYSEYITKAEEKEFESNLNQKYKGIGIRLEKIDTTYIVTEVLKNSPAEQTGVLQGDIIFKINQDLITAQTTINQIVQKIRGEQGTVVKIQFIRSGKPIDLEITRADIKADLITMETKGKFAIITISSFGEGLDAKMQEISAKILKDPNIEKIIIDVRSDTGGLLNESVDVLSYFVEPNSTIVQEKSKDKKTNGEEFRTQKTISKPKSNSLIRYPLFVLTDKFSASASEILAGALRDIRGAKIYGEKTFGKGVVQQLFPLQNGDFVKLTIAEWLTPKGQSIDKIGINPDVEIPLDLNKPSYDPQELINRVISENS